MLQHMPTNEPNFLAIQGRGVITLPAALRRRHRLDEPGAQVEVRERDDGVIELIPHHAVPADQAWFWTPEWQQMEREADEDIAAGRVTTYDSAEDFARSLDELADE
jgi:bifunctional DNA-binding transcriptional regulator/antitoxin component of YhaV-PrlF toxin-antitoxin module